MAVKSLSRGKGNTEVVVVTGASAGVGRAIAREFARHGAKVGLLARSQDGLDGAARDVERLGGRALAVATDVSDDQQVEEAADRIERALGPIDIWVNNAMVSVLSPYGATRSWGGRANRLCTGLSRYSSAVCLLRGETCRTRFHGVASVGTHS